MRVHSTFRLTLQQQRKVTIQPTCVHTVLLVVFVLFLVSVTGHTEMNFLRCRRCKMELFRIRRSWWSNLVPVGSQDNDLWLVSFGLVRPADSLLQTYIPTIATHKRPHCQTIESPSITKPSDLFFIDNIFISVPCEPCRNCRRPGGTTAALIHWERWLTRNLKQGWLLAF